MLKSVFMFVLWMVIPGFTFAYTVNFGRWLQHRKQRLGAVMVYTLGAASIALTGIILWTTIV